MRRKQLLSNNEFPADMFKNTKTEKLYEILPGKLINQSSDSLKMYYTQNESTKTLNCIFVNIITALVLTMNSPDNSGLKYSYTLQKLNDSAFGSNEKPIENKNLLSVKFSSNKTLSSNNSNEK